MEFVLICFKVSRGVDAAISFEAKTNGAKFNEKRQARMKTQVMNIWNKMISRLEYGNEKKCLYDKVTDSPGDYLDKTILGEDCALDIENGGGLKNMCKQLESFMLFAYSDCENPSKKADRLQKRCRKMRKVLKN